MNFNIDGIIIIKLSMRTITKAFHKSEKNGFRMRNFKKEMYQLINQSIKKIIKVSDLRALENKLRTYMGKQIKYRLFVGLRLCFTPYIKMQMSSKCLFNNVGNFALSSNCG